MSEERLPISNLLLFINGRVLPIRKQDIVYTYSKHYAPAISYLTCNDLDLSIVKQRQTENHKTCGIK